MEASPFAIETEMTKFDLLVQSEGECERFAGRVGYATDLYEEETIERL